MHHDERDREGPEPSEPSPSAGGTHDPHDEPRPWPTEPPVAGSTPPDAWPTEPPERDDFDEPTTSYEPVRQPPPEEVEAYPAAPAEAVPPAQLAASGPEPAWDEAATGPAAPEPEAAVTSAAHSVPATSRGTGDSTRCPRCGTENRAGLAFCSKCGQRLVAAGLAPTVQRPGTPDGTQACPRCGTHNRGGVAFCQNCGANLRAAAPGYVPPSVAGSAPSRATEARRGAVLGPIVMLIGIVGLATAYLLPFAYGTTSLLERAVGAGGYGPAFWTGYEQVGGSLADQAYFGFAAPTPLLALLLLLLAGAGFARATPGMVQTVGLFIALLWGAGLAVLIVVVEVLGNWDGEIVALLSALSPAGIIFFLASLVVIIGTLTRFGRG